jgi:hypothetical protein
MTTSIIGGGCASGPKYGASGKRSKSCDCPHWNAVPKQEGGGTWSMNESLQGTAEHGTSN